MSKLKKVNIKFEIASYAISILLAFIIPYALELNNEIGWFIGILSTVSLFTLVAIKFYLHDIVYDHKDRVFRSINLSNTLTHRVAHLSKDKILYANKELQETFEKIKKIERGIIPLTESDYYHLIIEETRSLNSANKVYAVNSIDERRFISDPRQRIYFLENVKAKNRQVEINRIFIVNLEDINKEPERIQSIVSNIESGINVQVVDIKSLLGNSDLLEDWVLFQSNRQKLYIDYQDRVDKTRISGGELLIDEIEVAKRLYKYSKLEEYVISKEELNKYLNRNRKP